MLLLPLSAEPFTAPVSRDMLPSERREFVRTHRTCVFATSRRADGPAMSVVYYVPTDTDELLISTMRGRAKARSVDRDGKVSLCVLDERWPFSYVQVYCDAFIDDDHDLLQWSRPLTGRMTNPLFRSLWKAREDLTEAWRREGGHEPGAKRTAS